MNTPVAICVALALKARKPVKLVLTREEDMYDHCSIPRTSCSSTVSSATAPSPPVSSDTVDIGCHTSRLTRCWAACPAGLCPSTAAPHELRGHGGLHQQDARLRDAGLRNPDVSFAVESHIDIIAEKLEIDPIELRLKNYVGLGEEFWARGRRALHHSQLRRGGDAAPGAPMIGWDERAGPRTRRGVPSRHRRRAHVPHLRHRRGHARRGDRLLDGHGQSQRGRIRGHVHGSHVPWRGTLDACAKFVAEEMGVPFDLVGVSPASTTDTGYDVCTHATRGVYCGAARRYKRARGAKARLLSSPHGSSRSTRRPADRADPQSGEA